MPVVGTKSKKKQDDTPEGLRPFVFHGMDVAKSSGQEYTGDCPLCGKEGKFYINSKSGKWSCHVCGEGGGISAFLKRYWETCFETMSSRDYARLLQERGLEQAETLISWEVASSIMTGEWILPAYGLDRHGKLYMQQLYRYVKTPKGMRLLAVPGRKHGVFGAQVMENKAIVYITEGPWDGMRLWESMRMLRNVGDGRLVATSNPRTSLAKDVDVISVPGCNAWPATMKRLMKSKNVVLCFDSDHPREHPRTGAYIPPAGFQGIKRAAIDLAEEPMSSRFFQWGPEGYDPDLSNGYDLRDLLNDDQVSGMQRIVDNAVPVPKEWSEEVEQESKQLSSEQCEDWQELLSSWKKALKWTEGLEYGLAVMLATGASTNSVGDQLWVKIIGPPSCGKSTLCEALSVTREFVVAKSTIRGFHSGFQSAGKDASLIPIIMGKTLVTKDGDTLLQSPNLGQILSEARDVYDSVSRTHYRNSVGKDYEGIRVTWILCGTESLRSIDNSELGQRFLDCVIMNRITDEEEDPILWRKVNAAADHVDIQTTEETSSQHDPELLEAMCRTGGYLEYLRKDAHKLLPKIKFSNSAKRMCMNYGKFVSYMRARPGENTETATREMAARLVSQHTRLAKCLALTLQRESVDSVVLDMVRRVCMDTSRGLVLNIVNELVRAGDRGLEVKGLTSRIISCPDSGQMTKMLSFLIQIEAVEKVDTNKRNAYRLTDKLAVLYGKVMQDAEQV